jgi:transcriptional regulator with XRE-family HTH domain
METIISKPISQRVRELRESLQYSQEKLAQIAGIDQADISKIETGKRTVGFIYARKLSRALNVPVSAFLDECHNFAENMANNP